MLVRTFTISVVLIDLLQGARNIGIKRTHKGFTVEEVGISIEGEQRVFSVIVNDKGEYSFL